MLLNPISLALRIVRKPFESTTAYRRKFELHFKDIIKPEDNRGIEKYILELIKATIDEMPEPIVYSMATHQKAEFEVYILDANAFSIDFDLTLMSEGLREILAPLLNCTIEERQHDRKGKEHSRAIMIVVSL